MLFPTRPPPKDQVYGVGFESAAGSGAQWYAGVLRRRVANLGSSSMSPIVTVVTEPRFAGRRLGQESLAEVERQGFRRVAIGRPWTHDLLRRWPARPP